MSPSLHGLATVEALEEEELAMVEAEEGQMDVMPSVGCCSF